MNQTVNIIDLIWNNNYKSNIIYTCSLFRDCKNIIEIDLSHFDSRNVTCMEYMFYGCNALTSINFGNFDTSKTTNMQFMFGYCISLKYLNLSSFNTSKVKNMKSMFYNCILLNSLKLDFNTSSVNNTISMFANCISLICLDLSSFDTSLIESMDYMFRNCFSLIYLDISNFKTSKVKNMISMFANCTSLISLNLNGFDTKNVEYIYSMFEGCSSLTSLDLSNFYLPKIYSMKNMFYGCSSLTSLNLSNFKPNDYITGTENLFYNCSSLFFLDISNLRFKLLYLKDANMFFGCSNLKYVNLKSIYFYYYKDTFRSNLYSLNNDIIVCGLSNFFLDDNSLCKIDTYCINNIYGINDSNDDYYCYIKCKEEINSSNFTCPYYYPENIELNNDTKFSCNLFSSINYSHNMDIINTIKSINISEHQCYFSCKTCDINGDDINHNCLECKENYKFELNMISYRNCYENCSYFYYIDNITNKYYCTKDNKCPDDYNKLIPNKKQCTNNCSLYEDYKYEYNNTCLNQYLEDLPNENIIENKRKELLKLFNRSDIDKGNDLEIYEDNLLFAITSTFNQQNENLNINKTTIMLDECETQLKNAYNISINDSLYIFKINKKIEGMKIPKIEYEVYYPLYTTELYQLNLSLCENIKIEISIPMILNDSLDKYDSNSDYYNNLCSKTTSESGTDISLADRKNEFIDNNMTICEENCELKNYNYNYKKVKCSCEIKSEMPHFDDIYFDINKLLKNFIDINNIGNLKIIKCIKDIFSKDFIYNNYGFFIFASIYILFIICLFSFYFKFYHTLIKQIKDIATFLKMMDSTNNIGDIKNIYTNGNISIKIKRKKLVKKNKIKSKNFPPKKKRKEKKFIYKNLNNNENINNKDSKLPLFITRQTLKFNDSELNSMKYKKALVYDKRSFSQYYFSLLKMYHLVFFSFYYHKDDYNPQIIKIFLFFFFFSIHLTTNALFFDDSTMHKIYIDKGKYNLIYQLPYIFYSSLISNLISSLILYLSLSEKDIRKLKNERKNQNLDYKINRTLKIIKIKFILFFIFSFVILFIFACYTICFCDVYNNTQIHLIKDSVISFILSLIYPFATYLIPSVLRFIALRDKGTNKSFIYFLSQLMEDIINI